MYSAGFWNVSDMNSVGVIQWNLLVLFTKFVIVKVIYFLYMLIQYFFCKRMQEAILAGLDVK